MITPFGDRALRFAIPPQADRRHLLTSLRKCPGVIDVVLAEAVGAVVLGPGAWLAATAAALAPEIAAALALAPEIGPAPARHLIRVVYDGPDLTEIATHLGLSTGEVVALHASRDYEVVMVGFMPGFAYLRGLDPRLVLPRRAEPRARVPAGSVGVAAQYTGIYPFTSPGGWNLLGRAVDYRGFDASGAILAVGDRVRFERAEQDEQGRATHLAKAETTTPSAPGGAHLEVRKAYGLALVVDGGRLGHMHEGVPHGGAMVPEALASANAAVGNEAFAAAIEVFGLLEVVARGGRLVVASDVGGRIELADGETLAIGTEGKARVRYLAVSGGIDVPVVLGGRGTLLAAGLGGYGGRGLRRGDRVESAGESESESERSGTGTGTGTGTGESEGIEVEAVGGPDAEGEVMEAIGRATFRISAASDRIGTRLEGPALPEHAAQRTHERKSTPMVRGAIEMTPSGLVVLGPDHPTTGGYPVVAVVRSDALGPLFARPIGAPVRLVISEAKMT